jgi:hypothetical protein
VVLLPISSLWENTHDTIPCNPVPQAGRLAAVPDHPLVFEFSYPLGALYVYIFAQICYALKPQNYFSLTQFYSKKVGTANTFLCSCTDFFVMLFCSSPILQNFYRLTSTIDFVISGITTIVYKKPLLLPLYIPSTLIFT